MTLKLCGFAVSNYYNKLKIQLLEKAVPFEEDLVWVNPVEPATLLRSPMGKVPFLETPQGCISESSVCAEYIEQAYPHHPLMPTDAFEAAKVREVRRKLEQAGFKTYTQVVEKDGKSSTRIRVGPFASREEADKVVARIRKLDLQATVLKL